MLSDCVFLEQRSRAAVSPALTCSAGANFSEVGVNREVCQLCPLGQAHVPLACDYLDADTVLRPGRVEVRLTCLLAPDSPGSARCATCPAASPGHIRSSRIPFSEGV